ncbi:MAG: hypothetical protein BWY72_00630 [Bacteroidetes bacterium ADurb.Bin416]|nr:MAG: hypothetical protein BWY72_00630 [Bacteroidetes bacterium ADurb.Bin416]
MDAFEVGGVKLQFLLVGGGKNDAVGGKFHLRLDVLEAELAGDVVFGLASPAASDTLVDGNLVVAAKFEGPVQDDGLTQFLDFQGQVRTDSDEAIEVLLHIEFVGKINTYAWLPSRFVRTEGAGYHLGNRGNDEGFRDIIFQFQRFFINVKGEGLVFVRSHDVAAGESEVPVVDLAQSEAHIFVALEAGGFLNRFQGCFF